jgi:hypothetical protein
MCVFFQADMTSSGLILVMYIIAAMDIPVFIVKQPELKLTPVDNKGHANITESKPMIKHAIPAVNIPL